MNKPPPANNWIRAYIGAVLVACGALVGWDTTLAGTGDVHFPRPPEIKKAVDFWTRVYSEIDTNGGFVHDSRELDIIYEVYPLPTYASPKQQHKIIRKRIRHYQRLLKKIADTPEQQLTREERRIRRLWGSAASPAALRDAAKRVRFQRGQSDRMNKGLKRASAFEGKIRKILRDKGVPEQLAALPHVESSYNPKVKSKAGAAGLWQIMPATGRRFLRVNNVVDERLDPYKATAAAAQLLKHNYSVLKSWPLAITAYNHGLSGVRRAVRKTGTTDIDTIVRQYNGRAFRFASRNFYAAFLAAYDVSSKQRGKTLERPASDVPVVTLNTYLPAAAIVETLGIDRQKLKAHNPDLGATVWSGEKHIPKAYRLHLPIAREPALVQAQVAELEQRLGQAQQVPDRFYRVRRGDNLAAIAQRHDTSITTLMAMNDLRSRHRIDAGQVLRIPKTADAPAVVTVAAASSDDTVPAPELEPVLASATSIDAVAAPRVAHTPATDRPIAMEVVEPTAVAGEADVDALPEGEERVIEETETVVIAQSDLAADPADYLVAEDRTIEVQVGETLGHYAHWLNVPTQQLRSLNGMRYGQHVIVGKRLRLAFAQVSSTAFEQRRKNFHTEIQNRFFNDHRIVDVKEHALTNGDNLWELSTQTYRVPLWLLRQYNPDLQFDSVLSLSDTLRVPVVLVGEDSAMSLPVQAARAPRRLVGLR